MWKKVLKLDHKGVHRPCIWCSETKQVIFTEEQLQMLSKGFVKTLCDKHNEALKIHGKWNRDLVKQCINEVENNAKK